MKYQHIFVGGTFDGLHRGHEELLRRAFAEGERVTVGLTSDEFVIKYKSQNSAIKTFAERKNDLKAWLAEHSWEKRATIVPIDDPYEPAASMPDLDALVVTQETKERGEEINALRRRRGLKTLEFIEVKLVPAADGIPISSARLRNGEIDRAGRLILPDSLRPQLRQPLGRVLTGEAIGLSLAEHRGRVIVAVGDVSAKTLLEAGVTPSLMIIDGKVGRKPYHELETPLKSLKTKRIKVASGPGFISQAAITLIKKWSPPPLRVRPLKGWLIEVEGEEDLLVLPVVVEAPLGSIVYYGQPAQAAWACGLLGRPGLVEVVVTEEKKKGAKKLLEQFVRKDDDRR